MKFIQKNTWRLLACLGMIVFSLPACTESHYYHEYNHHTKEWYGHHHTPPPPGVNFEVDVRH